MGSLSAAILAARPSYSANPAGSIPTSTLQNLYQTAANDYCSMNPADPDCANPQIAANLISGYLVSENPAGALGNLPTQPTVTDPMTLVQGGSLGISASGQDAAGNQYPAQPGYPNVFLVPIRVLPPLRIAQYIFDASINANVPTGQFIGAGYIPYYGQEQFTPYSNTFGIPSGPIVYTTPPAQPIVLPAFLSAPAPAARPGAPAAVTGGPTAPALPAPGSSPIVTPGTPVPEFTPASVPTFTPTVQRVSVSLASRGVSPELLPVGSIGTIGSGLASVATFGVSIIGAILGSLFGSLFGGSDAANQIASLRAEMSQAVDTLMRFAWKVAGALGTLLQAFEHIWVTMLHRAWDMLKWFAGVMKKLLTDVLPKVLTALQNLRKLMQYVYLKFIRPALVYLQLIRRYLVILKLLHVPFAAKLDGILVQIQGKILAPYFWILRQMNGYGGWLNVILTAGAVLQRAVFINTMYAYQADWINIWWAGQARGTAPGGPPTAGAGAGPPTTAQTRADFTAFVQADAGPLADVATQAQQSFIASS